MHECLCYNCASQDKKVRRKILRKKKKETEINYNDTEEEKNEEDTVMREIK